MKPMIIDDPEGNLFEIEDWQAERDLQLAALDAMHRAREFNTEYVIWEDGEVKCLKPNETEKYERAGLENLKEINRRIAELEKREMHEPMVLKDEPPKKK